MKMWTFTFKRFFLVYKLDSLFLIIVSKRFEERKREEKTQAKLYKWCDRNGNSQKNKSKNADFEMRTISRTIFEKLWYLYPYIGYIYFIHNVIWPQQNTARFSKIYWSKHWPLSMWLLDWWKLVYNFNTL